MVADPLDIRGWQRLSGRITTSGKLEAHDPARLAALGVRQVINLALADHPEALVDEAEQLASLGLAYTHIPVPFDAPTPAHYELFREALDAAKGPVHIHCIMNWRVSAFFYLLNRESGMDDAEARAIMAQQWDPAKSNNPAAKRWDELIKTCAG